MIRECLAEFSTAPLALGNDIQKRQWFQKNVKLYNRRKTTKNNTKINSVNQLWKFTASYIS